MTVAFQLDAAGGRRGRVFVTSSRDFGPELERASLADFMDEEDALRAPLLREVLSKAVVVAWAHPGVDPEDVVHVYVQPLEGGERLFACAIVSQDRLERMLREAPSVLEGFSLQVVEARHLSVDAIGAAVEAWAERSYPDLQVPAFLVEPWRPALEMPGVDEHVDDRDREGDRSARFVEPGPDVLKIGSREMPRQAVA